MKRYTPKSQEVEETLSQMENATPAEIISIWNDIGTKWTPQSLIEIHGKMKKGNLLAKVIQSLREA